MALPHRTTPAAALFGILLAVEATTFFVFATAHLGPPLALGSLRIEEPSIPAATLVEGFCGLLLLSAAYSMLSGAWRRWRTTLRAHLVALFCVLLGFGALELGFAPRTAMGDAYLRAMLALLATGLVLSLAQRWRANARRRAAASLRWRDATS